MPTPRSPWTQRALDELADGEWHRYDDAIAAALEMVPPGRAYRVAEANRLAKMKRWRKLNGADHLRLMERQIGDRAQAIRTGQRLMLQDSILRRRDIETKFVEGVRFVRRRIDIPLPKTKSRAG